MKEQKIEFTSPNSSWNEVSQANTHKLIANKIYKRLRNHRNSSITTNNFAEFHRLMKREINNESVERENLKNNHYERDESPVVSPRKCKDFRFRHFTKGNFKPTSSDKKQEDSLIFSSVEKSESLSKISESLELFSKENHSQRNKISRRDSNISNLPIFNISTHHLSKRKQLLSRKCCKRVSKDEYCRSWTKGKFSCRLNDANDKTHILDSVLYSSTSRNQGSCRKIAVPKQKEIDFKKLIQFQMDQSQSPIEIQNTKSNGGTRFSRLLDMRLIRSHP